MTPYPPTTASPMQLLIYFLCLWICTSLYTTTTHLHCTFNFSPTGSLISLNHLKHEILRFVHFDLIKEGVHLL